MSNRNANKARSTYISSIEIQQPKPTACTREVCHITCLCLHLAPAHRPAALRPEDLNAGAWWSAPLPPAAAASACGWRVGLWAAERAGRKVEVGMPYGGVHSKQRMQSFESRTCRAATAHCKPDRDAAAPFKQSSTRRHVCAAPAAAPDVGFAGPKPLIPPHPAHWPSGPPPPLSPSSSAGSPPSPWPPWRLHPRPSASSCCKGV